MNLLPNEVLLRELEGVTLTTHRVRLDLQQGPDTGATSITLDAVASCAVATTSQMWLLGLAALSAVGGVIQSESRENLVMGLAIAGVCVIAYLLTRTQILKISSAGDAVIRRTRGKNHATLIEFIEAVERAKFGYLGNAQPVGIPCVVPVADARQSAVSQSETLDARNLRSNAAAMRPPVRVCSACEQPAGPADMVCSVCGNGAFVEQLAS
jgi:hypothetical protein